MIIYSVFSSWHSTLSSSSNIYFQGSFSSLQNAKRHIFKLKNPACYYFIIQSFLDGTMLIKQTCYQYVIDRKTLLKVSQSNKGTKL